jgi:hypothetical protein
MFRFGLFLLTLLLLAPCSNDLVQQTNQARDQTNFTNDSVYQVSQDEFIVKTWVNKPNPSQDDLVTLYGSLIKNGVHLGGMMMQATWPDPNQERGTPNCNVLVIYQTGVCTIEAGKYPSGEYLPITVVFDYGGSVYKGETGFTPR